MTLRIYTYKITFEEIPHWYWGVHKESKFGEVYLGSPVTNAWIWEFYTPVLTIVEVFPYTEEGWIEANIVEDRLITPDLNNPLCLNEACGGRVSLKVLRENGRRMGPVNGVQSAETNRKQRSAIFNEENRERGREAQRANGVGFHRDGFHSENQERLKENKRGVYDPEVRKKGRETQKELGLGLYSKEGREKSIETRRRNGSGFWNPEVQDKIHKEKTPEGKSVLGVTRANNFHKELYEDPDHPELGAHHLFTLKKIQRQNGLSTGKENRRKVQ